MTQQDWQQAQVDRIGEAIKTLRGDRSAQWLSDATDALGLRVNRSTISDIETGRRKYVALHELVIVAAALGTTPAALVTFGTVPDGELDLLPGRTVNGIEAVDWIGGKPLSRFSPAAVGLPEDHAPTAQLIAAARERNRVRDTLVKTQIGGLNDYPDPALVPALKERLTGIIRRIRELGGVIKESVDGSG
ncbi:helix-turn-helix transcriptional regulator [Mycobacteroides abscessus subsp. abscessus]|uniref:helix-turn-helix domain-containing protein n=1 Tax=Mycobacteroides abscessus TaxID=36809 RepID=UPI0009A6537B|nr:helix-turn-helix transcriptional regulator [Mycobacteroides abscessus]QSM93005.1 helix-turn-helix transcriptional regulator [Mycobacteroides abscessus subsp. abscessus]QSM98043.1 helix-turn-helix transcriptional regulator [Mycobacteroides abscessus subsp. abscessus]SLI40759.1 Putative DNA-binding protein [Mycobacteroides abscessus subsp. abscessus]